MMWTDDPVADAERYMAKQQTELDKLPKCFYCGKPITTDECYEIEDHIICPDCLNEHHRKWVDDYVS